MRHDDDTIRNLSLNKHRLDCGISRLLYITEDIDDTYVMLQNSCEYLSSQLQCPFEWHII